MTRECDGLDIRRDLLLVTNALHAPLYEAWADRHGIPRSAIINDGTTSNDNRLGAIADIALAIERAKIDDDLMIVGGT